MKGLTLLWMCLCCLRPEDVANVLPQSEQAWARAPTCCERMCLCRLLGSVNTCWGKQPHRHTGELPSASTVRLRAATHYYFHFLFICWLFTWWNAQYVSSATRGPSHIETITEDGLMTLWSGVGSWELLSSLFKQPWKSYLTWLGQKLQSQMK